MSTKKDKFDIDQLSIDYTGMFDAYKFIVKVRLPYCDSKGPNRIITKTIAQAKAFKNRSSITNIQVWPNIQPKKEIRKKNKFEGWRLPQVLFTGNFR